MTQDLMVIMKHPDLSPCEKMVYIYLYCKMGEFRFKCFDTQHNIAKILGYNSDTVNEACLNLKLKNLINYISTVKGCVFSRGIYMGDIE